MTTAQQLFDQAQSHYLSLSLNDLHFVDFHP
jgi:hypothetical protein